MVGRAARARAGRRRRRATGALTSTSVAARLLLVRHGESEWNASGRIQGQSGVGLSAKGHDEAQRVAAAIAASGRNIAAIVRSDLQRVAETCAPIEGALGLRATVDERLREADFGTWTGRTHAELEHDDHEAWTAWASGEDVPRGGGETNTQVRRRIIAALEDAAPLGGGGDVVVVTHGGPIRCAVAALLGLPRGGEALLAPVRNASVTELDLGDRRRLVVYASSTVPAATT